MYDDANLNHPWAKNYRLAVIGNMYPHYAYILTLTVPTLAQMESEHYLVGMPTEHEAKVTSRYMNYIIDRQKYTNHYRGEMLMQDLDSDPGFNTVSLLKRKDGTWYYRRSTWTQPLAPLPDAEGKTKMCHSIEELLDYIEMGSIYTPKALAQWESWKAENLTS